MKTTRLLTLSILVTLLVSACGMASGRSVEPLYAPSTAGMPQSEAPFEASDGVGSNLGQVPAPDAQRLVIRNADLTIVVQDPAARAREIALLAEGTGGFVVSSNVYQSTFGQDVRATQADITVRVPADALDPVLEQIKAGAVEVRSENISGQDVTQEYTDLQAQLRNLEAAESELREIMASLTKAEDVLRVFDDLRQVRQEIEVIKGRIQYYEQSARLSAVSVSLLPDVVSQPIKIGRWQPQGTAKSAVEALVNVLRFLADAAIVIIILILPILILLSLPFLAIRWFIRRRRARRSAGTPES